MKSGGKSCYEFGKFRLQPAERLLTCEDRPISLAPRTFDTLVALVERKGHLVGKNDLLETVWRGSFVEEVNLTVHVSALRKALGKLEDGSGFIETVPKRGYRFIAPVKETTDSEIEVLRRFRLKAVDEEIETEEASQTSLSGASASLRKLALAAGAVFVIAVISLVGSLGLRRASSQGRDFSAYSWKALSNDNRSGMSVISPSGEFLVFFQPAQHGALIKMRRLASDETITISSPIDVPCWGITISHDNNFLYYVLADRPSVPDGGTLYRVSVLGGQPRKILEGITVAPTLSPDDRRLGFMRNGPGGITMLITANASDGSDERVISTSEKQEALWNPQWSPDGKRFACFVKDKREDGTYFSLVEMPADGGAIKEITEPSKKYIWWHSWLHDGSGLLAIRSDETTDLRQLVFVSYPDGAIHRISNDLNQYAGISVSDDGRKIITDRNDRQRDIVISDGAGNDTTIPALRACCPNAVGWISDREIVFDAVADGKRALWKSSVDGSGEQKLSSTSAQDWSPSISPDRGSIVFLSTRSGLSQIWRSDPDGREALQLTNVSTEIDSPRYSPKGPEIYFSVLADTKWKVARINAAGGSEPEIVLDENVSLWDISPDGELIAYAFWPQGQKKESVAIARIGTGEIVNKFDVSPTDILRWTHDGKQLIYEIPDPKNAAQMVLGRLNVTKGPPAVSTTSNLVDYAIDQSPNGRQFAYIRGHEVEDMVMLSAN